MRALPPQLLRTCLVLLLKPVAAFCLRHSVRLQDVVEALKEALVASARTELSKTGHKHTASRLSAMTGVYRSEVARLSRNSSSARQRAGIIVKVMGLWQTHADYLTKAGLPRVLECESEDSEFYSLVQSVSRDMNPKTILFELQRVGAVERTKQGAKLMLGSYEPRGDEQAIFQILSEDMEDLICAVEENAFDPSEVKNLHARTVYDRVRADRAKEIREWLLREGHALHAKARNLLSGCDQDICPDPDFKGKTIKVILGSYGRVYDKDDD